MNFWRQAFWLSIFCAAAQMAIAQPQIQNDSPQKISSLSPPFPPGYSPVDLFRQLLAMTPDEREKYLATRPPEIRQRILAKIDEYLTLGPDERELRLRATELHWYLTPLLRESPTNYQAQLEKIPAGVREIVRARLMQWEILPPPLQQEFLENERALSYFTHVDATNNLAEREGQSLPNADEQVRWNNLSDNQRKIIANQFNQFFELTPNEQQQTLNTLSDAERAQMEKTLQAFNDLPPLQRIECIRAFQEFESMSAQERAEFLKNAGRWSQLTPKERQAWRDLVTDVPNWPPLPPEMIIMPQMPQRILPQPQTLATNLN